MIAADTDNHDLAWEFYQVGFERYGSRTLRPDLIERAGRSGCQDLVLAAQVHRAAHQLANIDLVQALAEIEQACLMAGPEPIVVRARIHWWLYHVHADILTELGRFEEAVDAHRHAADVALAHDLAARWELSTTLWADTTRKLGDARRILEILDLLLDDSPFGMLPSRRALADVLLWLGRPRLSVEIRRGVVENPEGLTHGAMVYDLVQMARALVDSGQPEEALSLLERAGKLCPPGHEWPNMRMRIATAWSKADLMLGHVESAIERLRELLRTQPGYPSLQARPLVLLAQALAAQQRFSEALAQLDGVDRLSAGALNLMDLHETRASVLQELARPEEASAHLQDLILLLDKAYVPDSRLVRVEQRLSAWRLDSEGERATQVEIDRRWVVNSRIMNLIAKDLRGPAASLVMGTNLANASLSKGGKPDSQVLDLIKAAMAELKLSIGHLGDADFVAHDEDTIAVQEESLSSLLEEARRASGPLRAIRHITLEIEPVPDQTLAIDRQLALRAVVGLIRAACSELPQGGWIKLASSPTDADVRVIVTGLDRHGRGQLASRLAPQRLSAEGAVDDQPSGWLGLSLTLSSIVVRGGRVRVVADPGSKPGEAPPGKADDFVVDLRFRAPR